MLRLICVVCFISGSAFAVSAPTKGPVKEVTLTVTEKGFEPNAVDVSAGTMLF